MHEPNLGDDLHNPPPAVEQATLSPDGATMFVATTASPSRKRPRTKGGRFVPIGADTETLTVLAPPAMNDPAPAIPGQSSADCTANMPGAASLTGDNAGERVVSTPGRIVPEDVGPMTPIVASGVGGAPVADTPALIDALPDLRRRAPAPVVPWHRRAQRRFRELTQPGRVEAEADAAIAALLARPALTSGCKTIAVLGAKGGAGKSTTALALGLTLGTCDAAKPVVMEVNPDLGNVRQLLPSANPRTVQDLLEGLVAAERGGVNRVQGYLTMWGRLGVLTAPQRPDEMARLSPRDYARVLRLLKLYFGTVILDCGTSFTNRLQQWAIQTADHLVLVTQPEEAPLLTTLTAIDYLASAAYAEDYRGLLREVADATGGEGGGTRGTRERRDMTLVVNGVGFAGARDPVDSDKIRAAAAGLNAVVDLPYSAPLRQRINDGVLTPEVLPAPYRRAIKTGLAAVLGRLAEA